MDSTILELYRHKLYHECFTRAADALFDLADALLTDLLARSLVELSQAPAFNAPGRACTKPWRMARLIAAP